MHALIDRSLIFGNAQRALARLSPDGRWISWLAPQQGVMNIFVAPTNNLDQAIPLTAEKTRGIQGYQWCINSDQLLFVQDEGGNENFRLFAVSPEGGEVRCLTPQKEVTVQLHPMSPSHPNTLIIGLNDRDARLHDLCKINLTTGELTRIAENPGYVGYVIDWDLKPRLAVAPTAAGGMIVMDIAQTPHAAVEEIPPEDAQTTAPLGYDKAGNLFWLDSRERNTTALFSVSPTGERTELAQDDRADISGLITDPKDGRALLAFCNYDRKRAVPIDEQIALEWASIEDPADTAEVDCVSASHDDRLWLLARADGGPPSYSLYDRVNKTERPLFASRPQLQDQPLSNRRPVVIKSRDGLNLMSYLSLPSWLDNDGLPSEPLPMVLYVHGGPWARDEAGYQPVHQLLSNRGYAVLSVNFRGSTGFGKDFLNAGDKQWAGQMHEDLLDAVDWAVSNGIAVREKVAIMGGSYGGYAALVGLTFTPEVFAAGVSIVGPSNILTLIASVPPYWEPSLAIFRNRVGDFESDEGREWLLSKSPLSKVEEICRPLLIAQGANDPRVKQAESDQIVQAMREKRIPVTYALFPDEGHGFARPENQLAFMFLTEKFLATHLGGRYQENNHTIEASTVQLDPV